jgi:opacity protein-like surface antigen
MFKTVALLTGLCVCLSTPAMSADGPYIGLNAGISSPVDTTIDDSGFNIDMSFKSGLTVGGALGYKVGMGRIEAEIGYKSFDADQIKAYRLSDSAYKGEKFSVLSLMANGYIDFDSIPIVKPYLMAGIGMVDITMKNNWDNTDDTVFAYQVGLGAGYALNDIITFDLGYRYMRASNPQFDGRNATYASHNALAGFRFNF